MKREVADASESDEPVKHAESLFQYPQRFLSRKQMKWLKPLEPPMEFVARILHRFVRMMMHTAFHLEASGLEHLPEKERFVLVPNHLSYLDPFAVAAALDFSTLLRTCWGGWTGAAFANPVARLFSRLSKVVPIDPERAVIFSLALGAAVLKRGNNLVWFPEGWRSLSGELQPFRPGIGLLLHHVPTTVVPVCIRGSYLHEIKLNQKRRKQNLPALDPFVQNLAKANTELKQLDQTEERAWKEFKGELDALVNDIDKDLREALAY